MKTHKLTKQLRGHIRLRSWHAHVHFPFAALLIGVWLCLGILTGAFLVFAGKEVLVSKPHAEPRYVTVAVQKVTYDAVGKEPFLPGTGYKFAIVELSITNDTNNVFNLAPVLQTTITDKTGQVYTMSPATIESPLVAGKVEPGETRQGYLTYIVPQKAEGLTFHFMDNEIKQSNYSYKF